MKQQKEFLPVENEWGEDMDIEDVIDLLKGCSDDHPVWEEIDKILHG